MAAEQEGISQGQSSGNAVLSYMKDGRKNIIRAYCDSVTYGFSQIGTESEARYARAFYPRRTATQPFSITVLLNGYAAYRNFNYWLAGYQEHLRIAGDNSATPPPITVTVAGRDFLRDGIPIEGMTFGDHVGSMLWQQSITFQATNDPAEKNDDFVSSSVLQPGSLDADNKYFYPFQTQLAGDDSDARYRKTIRPSAAELELVLRQVTGGIARGLVGGPTL